MIDSVKFTESINTILKNIGILDILKQDSSVYVGGSLPAFIISQQLQNKNDLITCNDIDLYTDNYVKTLHNISKHLGNKMVSIKRTGVNVSFLLQNTEIPIQIVTSEFKSFYNDVLANYDCTLVSVGYYPYKDELIIHERFLTGLNTKTFICYYERSNLKRIAKLTDRATNWFSSTLKIVKETDNADFRPYYKKSCTIESLQDIISPPNYVQLYYNKFNCISCNVLQEYLLCCSCNDQLSLILNKSVKIRDKKIVILGGVNGLGKVISNELNKLGNQVYVTTRNPEKNKDSNVYKYVLGEKISDELMLHLLTADIIILNAYSTLDNDEKIWLTTLDNFDEELALNKFTMNTIGYVRFLQEFVRKRKEYIRENNLSNNIQIVFMDANESRLSQDKLADGKHLELNLAKTATKQIFYTNANLLASIGILTICYDPGWLSYHGISVDKIESKSKYLINPVISVLCLLEVLGNTDFTKCIEEKKVIFDKTVYEVIRELQYIFLFYQKVAE